MRDAYSTRHGPRRRTFYREPDEALIEKLTGWQRKQWQRAGSPRDEGSLRRFARLQRDGSEVYEGEVIPPHRP